MSTKDRFDGFGRRRGAARPLAGLVMIVATVAVIATAAGLFRGSFADSVAVTVMSPRAGLVMNPDAKVNMLGVQVGKVTSIEELPDGRAAIHLAIDPSQLHVIPSNVAVEIASNTVFGAKSVRLVPPVDSSPRHIQPGQVLDASRVTVEINTVFQRLTNLLSRIEPAKLNETLGALAAALNGRGNAIGQMLSDVDSILTRVNSSLANLTHDIAVSPQVLQAYADAAPDLTATMDNATQISRTIVSQEQALDALLISATGLADIGIDVLGTNRQSLADALHLLVPTTDLTNAYNSGLTCALQGMVPLLKTPPFPYPGIMVSVGFVLGIDRYRYPRNLPKVAATGGPHCMALPELPPGTRAPFLVADVGANPWQYGNQGIVLNADGLKQMLFGPLDGPPRNTAQIGQPG